MNLGSIGAGTIGNYVCLKARERGHRVDATGVRLIADPQIGENVHEVEARGEFGEFAFRIVGRAVPDNPRTSALAAMSVISSLEQETGSIRFY